MRSLCLIIICCFCIFACKAKEPEKPKEEIKKIGNIDKPLNLSLLFRDEGGIIVSKDTIDGNIIETLRYPYSIDIVNDSIIFTARKMLKNKEHRGKLTDEQLLEIKKMVSALNQKYEIPSERIGPYDASWLCILEIDNQVHYIHGACADNYGFTMRNFSLMPKEIFLLFRYIVDLSPIRIKF